MLEGGRDAHTSIGHSLALGLRVVVIMLPLVPSYVRRPAVPGLRSAVIWVFTVPALGKVWPGGKTVTNSSSYLCHYTFLSGTAGLSQAKTGMQKTQGSSEGERGLCWGGSRAPKLLSWDSS